MSSCNGGTLHQLILLPGIGPQIFESVPLLDRARLRQTCRAFLPAVDESLESVSELFWEDISDVATRAGGLDWLLPKCAHLHTLSLHSRMADGGGAWERRERTILAGLPPSRAMPSQSLLVLCRCTHLRALNLAGCADVTDAVLTAVAAACRILETLDVSGCGAVTDAGVTALASSCPPRLRELVVGTIHRVTDASVHSIAEHCPALTKLSLMRTRVTDAGLCALGRHRPSLRHLDVGLCRDVTDAGISAIASGCPDLRHLSLAFQVRVTDASMTALARHCRLLQGLSLHGCDGVTATGIYALAERCPSFEHLELIGLFSDRTLSGSALLGVAAKWPLLTHLEIRGEGMCAMYDGTLQALAEGCPRLRHLSCRISPYVTDVGIGALAVKCPQLRQLDVAYCRRVTDASMRLVGEHCRNLEELRVRVAKDGGEGGDEALRVLVESCRGLEILSIFRATCRLDGSMAALGRACDKLRYFKAGNCQTLSDANVTALVSGPAAPRLHTLHILKCTGITDESLFAISRACTQLRSLNLYRCEKLTDAGARAVATGCTRLAFLDLLADTWRPGHASDAQLRLALPLSWACMSGQSMFVNFSFLAASSFEGRTPRRFWSAFQALRTLMWSTVLPGGSLLAFFSLVATKPLMNLLMIDLVARHSEVLDRLPPDDIQLLAVDHRFLDLLRGIQQPFHLQMELALVTLGIENGRYVPFF
eukprot:jgi/Mesvir1/15077/Mv14721-RA.1